MNNQACIPTVSLDFEVASESAIIIYLAPIAESTQVIAALCNAIKHNLADILIEIIPSYHSILVCFEPLKIGHSELFECINGMVQSLDISTKKTRKLITLPVYYDENICIDLVDIAQEAGISVSDVIQIHQSNEYLVKAIGFAPGFAYLGDVDSRIARARLATPRTKVPKGAVAIANNQTAIYPQSSPGGWNIIGLCPTPLFIPDDPNPLIFNVGDRVKFEAIELETFLALGGELVDEGIDGVKR